MTITIELSDEQAVALHSKAAAHGLTLADWLRKLAEDEVEKEEERRPFALADRYGLTFYDAAYLELALRQALPLASLDDHLRRTAVACESRLFEPAG